MRKMEAMFYMGVILASVLITIAFSSIEWQRTENIEETAGLWQNCTLREPTPDDGAYLAAKIFLGASFMLGLLAAGLVPFYTTLEKDLYREYLNMTISGLAFVNGICTLIGTLVLGVKLENHLSYGFAVYVIAVVFYFVVAVITVFYLPKSLKLRTKMFNEYSCVKICLVNLSILLLSSSFISPIWSISGDKYQGIWNNYSCYSYVPQDKKGVFASKALMVFALVCIICSTILTGVFTSLRHDRRSHILIAMLSLTFIAGFMSLITAVLSAVTNEKGTNLAYGFGLALVGGVIGIVVSSIGAVMRGSMEIATWNTDNSNVSPEVMATRQPEKHGEHGDMDTEDMVTKQRESSPQPTTIL